MQDKEKILLRTWRVRSNKKSDWETLYSAHIDDESMKQFSAKLYTKFKPNQLSLEEPTELEVTFDLFEAMVLFRNGSILVKPQFLSEDKTTYTEPLGVLLTEKELLFNEELKKEEYGDDTDE